jgi:hypothetical protein
MLIFIDGRAVAASGDSLLAFTRQGTSEIVVRDRRSGAVYRRGTNTLLSPHHIQEMDGRWYVSDAEEGTASVVVFSGQWDFERRIAVQEVAAASHQFAVLPDGRIVVEATDQRLVSVGPDSATTFALVEPSDRTGLLVAALGGVLHAAPGRAVTLYNAQGNIRWRQPWDWAEGVYVTDVAVDGQGRIHVLAGEALRNTFRSFTLSPTTGEVIRWSEPGATATFVVERLGETRPDSTARWIGD